MKKFVKLAMITAAPAAMMAAPTPAAAGPNDYLGELSLVGYNFCPRGTIGAEGQLLPIAQNQALFSLWGTIYGGDGRTTFGVPDLRGRAAMNQGTGAGLTPRSQGARGGVETVVLNVTQLPSHNHTGEVRAENTAIADTGNPAGNAIARSTLQIYSNNAAPTAAGAFHPGTLVINNNGGSQAHNNMSPFLVMRYCAATTGVFPSRN